MARKARITPKQKTARRKNIAVARRAKKKGSGLTASQKAKSKKLTINQAANILRKKGASLGVGQTKLDKKTGHFTTKYKVTTKSGKSGWVTAKDLRTRLAKYL